MTARFIRPHYWGDKKVVDRDHDTFRCRWCGLEATRGWGADEQLPDEHCPESPVVRQAELPIQLVATLIQALYTSTLMGNPPPSVAKLNERMRNPQVGDLVAESSAWTHRTAYGQRDDLDGLGWLVAIDRELVEDEENPGELRDIGTRYVMEPLDRPGETFAWGNADITAVPTSSAQLYEWNGSR